MLQKAKAYINSPVSSAPLAAFRILFGFMMLFGTVRFIANGWIDALYVQPKFYFPYYGFEWVPWPGESGMYLLFTIMGLSAIGVMLGYRYRIAAVLFFLSFTWIELIDKSNYLNHYYFVSLMALVMIFLPAHRAWSLDARRNPGLWLDTLPRWTVGLVRIQLGIVYFYAGIAKVQPDWLIDAMPLTLWLPAHQDLPLIGGLLTQHWVAIAFSWAGCLYDLFIPFLLISKRWRPLAYMAVIGFHVMTGVLFQIGLFPYIMIMCTLVFFSGDWHERNFRWLAARWSAFRRKETKQEQENTQAWPAAFRTGTLRHQWLMVVLAVWLGFQALFPFRYLLYPGDLFWTEQGYRFGWRVMLMEKAGVATFHVHDLRSGRKWEARNSDFLTPNQEKMMATQPDMLWQFAQHLEEHYAGLGYDSITITAESYVTLNGSQARLLIDPEQNLLAVEDNMGHKDWILPAKNNKTVVTR